MTAGTPNELAERVWDSVFSGRIPELETLFATDAEMMTSTSSGQGVEYIKGMFRRHLESYPDMKHEVLSVTEDGTAASREVRFTGSHLGELRNPKTGKVIPPTGRTVSWVAAEFIRTENGRITTWHAYFDRMALMEQFTDGQPR